MIVEFTSAAEADLDSIGAYIARDNPARALSFVRELIQSCLELSNLPEAWPVVPRYQRLGIRRRVHGRYLIFYRIMQERIVIVHVLNGAIDVDVILFPAG
ncbi:type II toxin-antitoxin system RelE/ParE family toxin [Falsirhodobacter xinxiangensis]|uniref:type II toxin-antitoxin system RelE/ParE family toxin n=1 Tax=Falsirhodobacter xinxiangensis TaxID=2530049 RepID=UPI0010AA0775|nr:type II toxin-antitoxin system RelE/ParE family toxin [Rhodobacter xinxiangensis]